MHTFEILNYQVALSRDLRADRDDAIFVAFILCRGQNPSQSLSLYFLHPDSKIPPNSYDRETKSGKMYVRDEMLARYIDVLRNEKPVYAYLDEENPAHHSLHTGEEPVGEGERGA